MIQRSAAGACLSTFSNALSTAAKPAADWPSFPRRLVDFFEGREAVEDLRRGRRVDARAVEDAGPVYNRLIFFFQAEDGIRDAQESRGLGDVYKRQSWHRLLAPWESARRSYTQLQGAKGN